MATKKTKSLDEILGEIQAQKVKTHKLTVPVRNKDSYYAEQQIAKNKAKTKAPKAPKAPKVPKKAKVPIKPKMPVTKKEGSLAYKLAQHIADRAAEKLTEKTAGLNRRALLAGLAGAAGLGGAAYGLSNMQGQSQSLPLPSGLEQAIANIAANTALPTLQSNTLDGLYSSAENATDPGYNGDERLRYMNSIAHGYHPAPAAGGDISIEAVPYGYGMNTTLPPITRHPGVDRLGSEGLTNKVLPPIINGSVLPPISYGPRTAPQIHVNVE